VLNTAMKLGPTKRSEFLDQLKEDQLAKRALFCKVNHLVGVQHSPQFIIIIIIIIIINYNWVDTRWQWLFYNYNY
jgi:hypothetical protein